MSTHFVTPSLMVGDLPHLPGVMRVWRSGQAIHVIQEGHIAVLTADYWSLVPEILESLGMSEEEIADRLRYARIGLS